MSTGILQLLTAFLMCSVKYLFGPSTAVGLGYSYWETILISIAGGWTGVIFFFYFGKMVVNWYMSKYSKKKKKSKFTRTNKMIIKVKSNFGIMGLALLGPVTISIPITSILAARYFGNNKLSIYFLMISIIIWAFILTTISVQFKELF